MLHMNYKPCEIVVSGLCRRELSTWWFHLHRALSLVGLVLAIIGAATGGNLTDDVYKTSGQSAHKALGILAVVAAALQVSFLRHLSHDNMGLNWGYT